jgi:hypothetical protein
LFSKDEKVLVDYGDYRYPALVALTGSECAVIKIRWLNDDPDDTWKKLSEIHKIKVCSLFKILY